MGSVHMSKMSRNKGKRGELEWAKLCTKAGLPSRRGQQFAGGTNSPDVIHEGCDKLHCEVKRVEQLNLAAALAQADEDAMKCQYPYVAHRKNGGKWMVTMSAPVFFGLLRMAGLAGEVDYERSATSSES